jgi:hypothetical protein
MVKVCKSDYEGTVAGTRGNGSVAPIPAICRGSEIGQVDPQQAFALTYRSDSPR